MLRSIQVDFPIIDCCNLGCKSCSHFSPLADKAKPIPVSTLEHSLGLLKASCDSIVSSIFIMGGEPMLHPDLPEIVSMTNAIFPKSERFVVSNMLLYHDVKETLVPVMLETRTILGMSCYGDANMSMVREAFDDARKNYMLVSRFGNVPANFWSYMKSVYPRFSEDGFYQCPMNACATLRGTRLYKCSPVAYLQYPRVKFGLDIKAAPDDWIDLRGITNPNDVLNRMSAPHSFCRHCDVSGNHCIGWSRSTCKASEWFCD